MGDNSHRNFRGVMSLIFFLVVIAFILALLFILGNKYYGRFMNITLKYGG